MLIKDIENSIISRLKSKISDLLVEPYPEKPENYFDEFIHPKGAILVHYLGSNLLAPKSINYIIQERRADFGIIVITRDLNLHQGAYNYLDKIRKALTGYRVEGCSKMYPVKEEFLDEFHGIWQYGMNFTLTFDELEPVEEENPVLLKKITIENNFGDTEVYQ